MVSVGVANKRHQWDPGVQRLNKAGNQVRRSRAERAITHTRPACHSCIGVGRKCTGPFVFHQIMPDSEASYSLINWKQLKPAHAEHAFYAMYAKHFGHSLPARYVEHFIVIPHRKPLSNHAELQRL